MSLRARLLLAFAAVVFVPVALLAVGLRQEMAGRFMGEYEERIDFVVATIEDDLRLESAAIGERLASVRGAILTDNRFRAAAIAGVETEQAYLRDYAETAMRMTGLSMLQIQDDEGRILSSGHFRNEYGRMEPGLAAALSAVPSGAALIVARQPAGDIVALARAERFTLAERTFSLIGGTAVDEAFLRRLARDGTIRVVLRHPGMNASDRADWAGDVPADDGRSDTVVREIGVPFIRSGDGAPAGTAQATLLVVQSLAPLRAFLRSLDTWIVSAGLLTGATALLLALWVSSRISRPLAALADKTAVLDLDRLDVEFDGGTDEVGRLSALLGELAARLRASTARVREAERRATIGDLARQVNHDIKNGLIPLRNVVRHLVQVAREDPAALAPVLDARRPTIDASIGYLETLAGNYERLARPAPRRDCDVNTIVEAVVRGMQEMEGVEVRTHLAGSLPVVSADPVAIRRILENLLTNAIESLGTGRRQVTLATERMEQEGEAPAVRVTVADTGRGMSPDEAARIFTDFYTTKVTGTGLGLSIVRRLVMDLQGTIRVESRRGEGTRMIVEMPARPAARGSHA